MALRMFNDPIFGTWGDPFAELGTVGAAPFGLMTGGDWLGGDWGRGGLGAERGLAETGAEGTRGERQLMTRPRCDVWEDKDSYRVCARLVPWSARHGIRHCTVCGLHGMIPYIYTYMHCKFGRLLFLQFYQQLQALCAVLP